MMIDVGKQVVTGATQGPSSNIRNPLLKIALVVLPITLGSSVTLARALGSIEALPAKALFWSAVVVYLAVNVDTRLANRRVVIRKSALAIGGLTIILLLDSEKVQIGFLEVTTIVLSAEAWAALLLFFLAFGAIRHISSRDALWFGRTFVVRAKLYAIYMVIIATYFVVLHGFGRSVSVAFQTAKTKFYLGRHRRYRLLAVSLRTFVMALLEQWRQMAEVADSLIEERGFLRTSYRDTPHASNWGSADTAAMLVLALGVGGMTLVWA